MVFHQATRDVIIKETRILSWFSCKWTSSSSCFVDLQEDMKLFSLLLLIFFNHHFRSSSLPDWSDAWQECRDQKSVWQHSGHHRCKWRQIDVVDERCMYGMHLSCFYHKRNHRLLTVNVLFIRSTMRNGEGRFSQRSSVSTTTNGWRWLRAARRMSLNHICMIMRGLICSTAQVRLVRIRITSDVKCGV